MTNPLKRRLIAAIITAAAVPMIAAMSNNINDYQAIASLPSFRLFPWFFLLPGVLVIVIALLGDRRRGRGAAERERPGLFNPVNQGVT